MRARIIIPYFLQCTYTLQNCKFLWNGKKNSFLKTKMMSFKTEYSISKAQKINCFGKKSCPNLNFVKLLFLFANRVYLLILLVYINSMDEYWIPPTAEPSAKPINTSSRPRYFSVYLHTGGCGVVNIGIKTTVWGQDRPPPPYEIYNVTPLTFPLMVK